MFDIFKKVKDKFIGDIKNKAIAKAKEISGEIIAMAKAMDLDGNGVKDIDQVQSDLGEIVSHAQEGVAAFAQIAKPAADLAKLGGLYYLKFGAKKPSIVVASLQDPAREEVA